MRFERSRWNNAELHLHLDGRDEPLTWQPGSAFDWHIGEVEVPSTTPQYVFEPRPVDRIRADLESSQDPLARKRLEEERALCDRPHVVYIAFYGTLPKVGMTSLERLDQRLREQGADAGFVLSHAEDRAGARAVENAATFQFGFPQWRTHREILAQWTKSVDYDRIQSRAQDLIARIGDRYEPEPLRLIKDHPLPVLASKPLRGQIAGHHAGTAVGAKGNYLVYAAESASAGTLDVGHPRLVALRHTDLEGRAVQMPSGDE